MRQCPTLASGLNRKTLQSERIGTRIDCSWIERPVVIRGNIERLNVEPMNGSDDLNDSNDLNNLSPPHLFYEVPQPRFNIELRLIA